MVKKLTFIILLHCISTLAQKSMIVNKNDFDKTVIVSKLFEAKYNKETKEFVWKPNYAEKLEFGVSNDGNLYTIIDTLLIYGKNKNIGTIVTSTYVKDENGKKELCHACAPSLSLITFELDESRENLELSYFKKFVTNYGSFAEPAKISVLQITEEDYCFEVSNEWIGTGGASSWISLYYLGKNILNFESYQDNFALTEDKNEQFSYDTNLSVDITNKKIILTTIGTIIDQTTNKKININKTENYIFNDRFYEYVKACN